MLRLSTRNQDILCISSLNSQSNILNYMLKIGLFCFGYFLMIWEALIVNSWDLGKAIRTGHRTQIKYYVINDMEL